MTERLHYTGCGLDWVYLVNGFKRHDTPYGRGVSITNVDGLHKVIAKTIVISPHRMRGQEVRFLRSMLDYSQRDIALAAGVTRASVARWEGDRTKPIPRSADHAIRFYYAAHEAGDETVKRISEVLTEIDKLEYGEIQFRDANRHWRRMAA